MFIHFNPEVLKRLREKRGLTRAELEARSGVDRETIYSWESGRRCPSARKLAQVARALGARLDDFFVRCSDISPKEEANGTEVSAQKA